MEPLKDEILFLREELRENNLPTKGKYKALTADRMELHKIDEDNNNKNNSNKIQVKVLIITMLPMITAILIFLISIVIVLLSSPLIMTIAVIIL